MTIRVIPGDCRTALQPLGPFDMLLADPPYGDTSLTWDKRCEGWLEVAADIVKPNGSMWVFGSMRFFQDMGGQFRAAGWPAGEAAMLAGRQYAGCEIDIEMAAKANGRLSSILPLVSP